MRAEFTGGLLMDRFNEAAGIHRRKPAISFNEAAEFSMIWFKSHGASMRPPEFTGGNGVRAPQPCFSPEFTGTAGTDTASASTGFNEAAGIHRRKHPSRSASGVATHELQ